MEARDFAELVKDWLQNEDDRSAEVPIIETRWGYGDSDFFVETDEGTFLVTVAKVAE